MAEPEDVKPAGVSTETPTGPEPSASPGEGTEGTGGDKPKGPTVAELANRNLQAVVDADLVHLDNRAFDKLNPKTVQLLSKYQAIVSGNPESVAEGEKPAEPARIFGDKGDEGSKPSHYETVGREAEASKALGEIRGQVEQEVIATQWANDVRAFLSDIGEYEITEELFAEMDFTDRRKFPATATGYASWQTAARKVYRELVKGQSEESEEAKGVNADRGAATGSKPQPNPKGSKAGIKDAVDLARRFRLKEISKEQFREGMEKFRTIS